MDQQQVDEAAQLEAAHQAQAVAAQVAPDGPFPNEQAAMQWIQTAHAHARFVSESTPSRELSIVVTRLEEAFMWAEKDLKLKIAADAERKVAEQPTPPAEGAIEPQDQGEGEPVPAQQPPEPPPPPPDTPQEEQPPPAPPEQPPAPPQQEQPPPPPPPGAAG